MSEPDRQGRRLFLVVTSQALSVSFLHVRYGLYRLQPDQLSAQVLLNEGEGRLYRSARLTSDELAIEVGWYKSAEVRHYRIGEDGARRIVP